MAKETQAPVPAPEVKAPLKTNKICKVSMTVDGCHLVAGEPAPELTKLAQDILTKLFGSLDKAIG